MGLWVSVKNVGINVPNIIATYFQLLFTITLPPIIQVNTMTQDIEEALEIMHGIRTKIMVLKDIKVMVFKYNYTKYFIFMYP